MRDHRGTRNPNRVLTPRLVREVMQMHARGSGYLSIARRLGVTKSCVQKVLTGRSWTHVTKMEPR